MSDAPHKRKALDDLPRAKVKRLRWPALWIWIVPLAAAIVAIFYVIDYRNEHGREIVIRFANAQGLKPGQTQVSHLGVEIGRVSSLELTADHSAVLVHVQLHQQEGDFARRGSIFWIERAEVSAGTVSGLTTVISGPFIDGLPGTGPPTASFKGLNQKPASEGPGITFSLQAARLAHLSRDSAVYFRGIEVGVVKSVRLKQDATGVEIRVFVRERYAPLVRANSQFWIDKGIGISGGLFSGLKLNVESLQALIGGAVTFATPDDTMPAANENAMFELNDEPKKEWLAWGSRIPLPAPPANDVDDGDEPKPATNAGKKPMEHAGSAGHPRP